MPKFAFRFPWLNVLARAGGVAAVVIGLVSPAAAITQEQVVRSANRKFGHANWTVKINGDNVRVSKLRLNTHSIKAKPLMIKEVHRATLSPRGQLSWQVEPPPFRPGELFPAPGPRPR
jgi:hypothetical protein